LNRIRTVVQTKNPSLKYNHPTTSSCLIGD
jgi:hypothetical protein